MINPVSSLSSLQAAGATPPSQTPGAPHKPNPAQDTVQLSPAAKAATGDVDHDGDSH